MVIVPLTEERLEEAAALFIERYRKLRQDIPLLPVDLENSQAVIERLEKMVEAGHALAALEDGHLSGYVCWFVVEDFRDTGRIAAYCPEWGHAATREVYLALYRAAVQEWISAGCQTYAWSYLANDTIAADFLHWNGYGMICVDAVRPIAPPRKNPAEGFVIRRAGGEDADAIALLEAEHCRYYSLPPTLMMPLEPSDAAQIREFLTQPENSIWLAERDGELAAYQVFRKHVPGAAHIVRSEKIIAVSMAFVRPQYRGSGAGSAVLSAALQYYAGLGYECCAVDFESINPYAFNFWLKHFTPVALSVMHHPELYLNEKPHSV